MKYMRIVIVLLFLPLIGCGNGNSNSGNTWPPTGRLVDIRAAGQGGNSASGEFTGAINLSFWFRDERLLAGDGSSSGTAYLTSTMFEIVGPSLEDLPDKHIQYVRIGNDTPVKFAYPSPNVVVTTASGETSRKDGNDHVLRRFREYGTVVTTLNVKDGSFTIRFIKSAPDASDTIIFQGQSAGGFTAKAK